jgi:outer membrane protein assembly factor BamD (BamD/ComL family)
MYGKVKKKEQIHWKNTLLNLAPQMALGLGVLLFSNFTESVELESNERYTRLILPTSKDVITEQPFELKEDALSQSVELRFFTSPNLDLDSELEANDPNGRIQSLDYRDQALKIQLSESRLPIKTYLYTKDFPPRVILDLWRAPDSSDSTEKASTTSSQGLGVLSSGVEGSGVQSNELPSPSSAGPNSQKKEGDQNRELASTQSPSTQKPREAPSKTNSSKSANKEAKNSSKRSIPSLETIYWDYPFLVDKGRLKEAVSLFSYPDQDYEPMKPLGERKVDSHYELIRNLYSKKDYALALKAIDMFHKKYTDHFYEREIQFIKASCQLRLQALSPDRALKKDSIQALKALIDYERDDQINKLAFNYLLSEAVHVREESSLAVETLNPFLEKTTRDHSLHWQAAYFLGLTYLNQGVFSAATEKLLIAEKAAPKNQRKKIQYLRRFTAVMDRLDKGNNLIPQEEFQALEKEFPKRTKKDPAFIFNRGESLFRLSRYEESLEYFDHFADRFPERDWTAYALVRMGEIFELQGENPKFSLELYKNALNRFPISEAAKVARARLALIQYVRYKKGVSSERFKFTMDRLEENIKSWVESNSARLSVIAKARMYLAKGEYESAFNFLKPYDGAQFKGEFASILDRTKSQSLESTLVSLIRDKRFKDAVELYESTVKTAPEKKKQWVDEELSFYMAYALFHENEYEKSKKLLSEASSTSEGVRWHRQLSEVSDTHKSLLRLRSLWAEKDFSAFESELSKHTSSISNPKTELEMRLAALAAKNAARKDKWNEVIQLSKPIFDQKNVGDIEKNPFLLEEIEALIDLAWAYYEKNRFTEMAELLRPWDEFAESYTSREKLRSLASNREMDVDLKILLPESWNADRQTLSEAKRQKLEIMYADALWYQRKHPQAIAQFGDFISRYPNSPYDAQAKYKAAMSLITAGDKKRGIDYLNQVVEDSNAPKEWVKSAEVELRLIDMEKKYQGLD